MSADVRLKGGNCGRTANVTCSNSLLTSSVALSARDVPASVLTRYKIFRAFLLNGSSQDLAINGSAGVEFSVAAGTDVAKWITCVRFLFNDTNLNLSSGEFDRFGSVTAGSLSNGITLVLHQGGSTVSLFTNPILYIGHFMDYATNYQNFVGALGAGTDFLSFDFDMEQPIPLAEGSADKIVCTINDDMSNLDLFEVSLFGYKETF